MVRSPEGGCPWIIGLVCLIPGPSSGQAVEADREAEVRDAAAAFIEAFNDLAWDRFTAAWAPDATTFFPMPGSARRIGGRDAIVAAFQEIFEGMPDEVKGPLTPASNRAGSISTSRQTWRS